MIVERFRIMGETPMLHFFLIFSATNPSFRHYIIRKEGKVAIMRLRFKILLFVILPLAGLIAGYALLLPRLPTGYGQVEAQRVADIREFDAPPVDHAGDSAASAAALKPDASTTTTTSTVKAAVPAESPREAFLRCWGTVDRLAQDDTTDPTDPGHARRNLITDLSLYIQQRERQARLVKGGFGNEEGLTPGAPDGERLFREKLTEPMRLTSERLAGKGIEQEPELAEVLNRAIDGIALAARASATPPHPDVLALMLLPAGAVPSFPRSVEFTNDSRKPALLFQAYLYALANVPGFDATAGLRLLLELVEFNENREYPQQFGRPDGLHKLAILAALSDRLSSATLASLSGELLRRDAEERDTSSTRRAARRRYQAGVIHDQMISELDNLINGAEINNNTFSFVLSGLPERAWFRLNARSIERKIDQFGVAMAEGDEGRVQQAVDDLHRQIRIANLRLTTWDNILAPIENRIAPRHLYREAALELALWSYRRDRGRLPDRVADLFSGYLPVTVRQQVLGDQIWAIQETPTHPVLWCYSFQPFSGVNRQFFQRMSFEQALQVRIQSMEREQGRPLNDEERKKIEATRDKFKQDYDQMRARGGFFRAEGIVLF